jgi:hypothetical protein
MVKKIEIEQQQSGKINEYSEIIRIHPDTLLRIKEAYRYKEDIDGTYDQIINQLLDKLD